jgi:hypothetical protein
MGASAPFFFSTRFEGKEAAPFETASSFYLKLIALTDHGLIIDRN